MAGGVARDFGCSSHCIFIASVLIAPIPGLVNDNLCLLQMAGVFLLCTRLKCNMNIKHLWDDVWSRYEFGRPDLPEALAQNSGADVKSVSGKR